MVVLRGRRAEKIWKSKVDGCMDASVSIDILAVEDNAQNLALLHAILERHGYRVHDAPSLDVARQLLAASQFKLILIDLLLPDGSGLALVGEARARDPGVPILVVSASIMPSDKLAAQAVGCNGFLVKPLMPQVLLKAVALALSGANGL